MSLSLLECYCLDFILINLWWRLFMAEYYGHQLLMDMNIFQILFVVTFHLNCAWKRIPFWSCYFEHSNSYSILTSQLQFLASFPSSFLGFNSTFALALFQNQWFLPWIKHCATYSRFKSIPNSQICKAIRSKNKPNIKPIVQSLRKFCDIRDVDSDLN